MFSRLLCAIIKAQQEREISMNTPYKNKEWLQKEVDELGNLQRVVDKYGWSKTSIYRWGKRLGVVAPEVDPQNKHLNKEWLIQKYEEYDKDTGRIAEECGVTKNTIDRYIVDLGLSKNSLYLSNKGQELAKETYQCKYWLDQQMEEHDTAAEVARVHGIGLPTVQYWAKKFGYQSNLDKENPKYDNKEWLINQYEQGKTAKEVSKQCGVSQGTISTWNKKHGIDIKDIQDDVLYPYKQKEWLIKMREEHGTGLKIAEATGYPVTSINRYIRKHKLRPAKKKKIKLELNHDFFEVIDTEEKAYWLGFLMADGNVYDRGNNYTISLKLQTKDRDSVIAFREALETNATLEEFEGTRKGAKTYSTSLRVNSLKMAEDLARYGVVPRKSRKERISENIPEELKHHFIRGYFDGDGHISKGSLNIATSHFMYEQTKEIFVKIGLPLDSIKRRSHPKVEVINVYRQKEIPKIAEYMYKDATIYMERKRNVFIEHEYL